MRTASTSVVPACAVDGLSRRAVAFAVLLESFATGVGHNPDPISTVRGTNGGSRYAMPLRIKPERGQVSENSLKAPSKQSCDVLHEDVAGS
jgi:hypothetical protein